MSETKFSFEEKKWICNKQLAMSDEPSAMSHKQPAMSDEPSAMNPERWTLKL